MNAVSRYYKSFLLLYFIYLNGNDYVISNLTTKQREQPVAAANTYIIIIIIEFGVRGEDIRATPRSLLLHKTFAPSPNE